MVGGLHAAFEDAQGFAGVERGFGYDFDQHGLAHVVGAGVRDQDASGPSKRRARRLMSL